MDILERYHPYRIAIVLFVGSMVLKYSLAFFIADTFVAPLKGSYQYLGAARNIHLHEFFAVESTRNVVLASDQIVAQGQSSILPNQFIAVFHGLIFNIFGFHPMLPVHVSILASSLTLVVLYVVVLRTFSQRVAVVFGILYLFSSVVLYEALWAGLYEFALLFFAFALVLIFKADDGNQYSLLRISLLGACMALTFLSRNAFALSFIPLTIYLYGRVAYPDVPAVHALRETPVRNHLSELLDRRAVVVVSVLGLSFIVVLVGGMALTAELGHSTDSRYMSDYFGVDTTSDEEFKNAAGYGHLYPDPYTYHFERDSYLQSVQDTTNPGRIAFLKQYGYETTAQQDRLLYTHSAKHYVTGFFAPNASYPPSPLILLLLGTGIFVLIKRRWTLAALFVGWMIFLYLVYIALWTGNWDHFLEVLFPVLALQSVGVVRLYDALAEFLAERDVGLSLLTDDRVLTALVIGMLVVHSVGIAGLHLYRPMGNSKTDATLELADEIQDHGVDDGSVVAYGGGHGYDLNYYADVSVVRFAPETVVRLLDNGTLQSAFDTFGVSAIVGYNKTVSCQIQNQTNVSIVEQYRC
jgi:hypothetical protein